MGIIDKFKSLIFGSEDGPLNCIRIGEMQTKPMSAWLTQTLLKGLDLADTAAPYADKGVVAT